MKQLFSKNKPIVFLLAILVFVVIVIIVAANTKEVDSIEGTYSLVDASGTGSEMFKATAGDAVLEIRSDDTGTLSMFEQETPVVVKESEQRISFDGGKNYSSYTLVKKKLTVDNGGYKAVFKKK